MTRSPRTVRVALVALALAALPALAACQLSDVDPAHAFTPDPATATAAPTTVYVRTAAPAPDVPAAPVTKPPAGRAPVVRATVPAAPTTTPRRASSTPHRAPAAPSSTRSPRTTQRTAAPVPPPVLGDPTPCHTGEDWDGTQCVARQLDSERIGRQYNGPGGTVCTVVAVDPDRVECTPDQP